MSLTGLWLPAPDRREELRTELEASSASTDAPPQLPGALLVQGAGDLRRLSSFREGHFRVMEIGSQLVVSAIDVEGCQRVADLCAGRGGKSLALAARLADTATVLAADLYEDKLAAIEAQRERFAHAGLARVETKTIDLSVGTAGLKDDFDLVFVDLPCTGTGTLHRRPELLLRLSPNKAEEIGAQQRAILDKAATLVRPGGRLVVAVCSLLPAEGAELRDHFVAGHPQFSHAGWPGYAQPGPDADGLIRIGPWFCDADGFQMFALRRGA